MSIAYCLALIIGFYSSFLLFLNYSGVFFLDEQLPKRVTKLCSEKKKKNGTIYVITYFPMLFCDSIV